ncbi:MAG: altronate dehydratase family protein [Armatimonadaceae bacterium]
MAGQAQSYRVHPNDDVAVLLSPALGPGTRILVAGQEYVTTAAVPSGHKIALRQIRAGEWVKKYGQPFGRATVEISPGEWVHTHNVETTLGANEQYVWNPASAPPPASVDASNRPAVTFPGFVRADGRTGIRNELWILCTVGCINRAAEEIARRAHARFARENGGSVDGVYAFTHPYGCAQIGSDLLQTRRAIAALAAHPNCGGILLMGLGCENNILQEQVAAFRCADSQRVRYFSAQETADEIEEAVRLLGELADVCSGDVRQAVPASALVLGMKCGGSDGFSGLTANPLVGVLADRHARHGGVSILTEVPEMFGAEKLLMERADSEETFHAIERMINGFKDYFRRYNEPISENPAPGNKAGGITTLEEKSLGCIQKGGTTAPVRYVLDYGEPLLSPLLPDSLRGGIALAYGPGNDAVSCTTLAAAGAQIVLFTTGRGTPFGTCVPTLKISTNSDLSRRKPHWIDFDAGRLVSEGASMEDLADELWKHLLAVASGETVTRNEANGYREIALFKDGVTT